MRLENVCELSEKYAKCPICGNQYVGNGQGTLIIDDTEFNRTCKCGWEVCVKELSDGSLIETTNTALID